MPPGAKIVVLGGPAMLIGLGGGAASSVGSGASAEDLDFASVQRGNPEIQRRAQEVIDQCWALGDGESDPADPRRRRGRPVERDSRIHRAQRSRRPHRSARRAVGRAGHVAAGDLVQRGAGALRARRSRRSSSSASRRCASASAVRSRSSARRPTTAGSRSRDPLFENAPVDVPLDVILGKPPKMTRDVRRVPALGRRRSMPRASTSSKRRIGCCASRRSPTRRSSSRSAIARVGGMISRDPMVGPWQVPVSDVAVTLSDYTSHSGEAMAMGERTPLALLDAPASGRMAVAEAITNIAAADIGALADVRLSANWMAACGEPGEDADLYATVKAVGEEFCPALGITIPVGKDSLSMKTSWTRGRARAQDGRAAVADRLGVRAGARRAPHADAAAAHRSRRQLAAADRSRRRTQSPRRLVSRAGLRQPRARSARLRRSRASREFLRRDRRAARARARCSRITIAPTAACSRRWPRWRSPAAAASSVDLGRGRAARSLRRCSAKSSARCCRFARSDAQAVRASARTSRPRALRERRSAASTSADRVAIRAGGKVVLDEARTDVASRVVRDELPHGRAARQPAVRARAVRSCDRSERSGPERAPDVRAAAGHRRAVHRQGRAAEGRDPARAGREQPRRDGGRVPSRRLHCRTTCT